MVRKHSFVPAFVGLCLLLPVNAERALAAQDPAAREPRPGLFASLAPADLPALPEVGSLDPAVKRYAHVGLRFDLIDRAAGERALESLRAGAPPPAFRFNLFDDVSLAATVDRVERTPDGKSVIWIGQIDGEFLSSFTIAVTGDVASGNIRTIDGRFYQIRYVSPGVFVIRDIDDSRMPPEGEPLIPTPASGGPAAAGPTSSSTSAAAGAEVAAGDDGSLIDVMVVFTPAVTTAAGGLAAVNNLITLAISETNQGYMNSGVIQRIRLVHSEQVAYTETAPAFDNALSAVTSTSDGLMDNVHTLRNTHGADMVSLWINDTQYCGLAWLMTTESNAFAVNAFSVVHYGCATGYYSFAHEMGHNQGSHHDRFVTGGSQGVKPYSFGFVQKSSSPNFRTIMAYANDCGSCTRVNYWSNPIYPLYGFPMGIADPAANSADNARSLNETRVTVANWRQSTESQPNATINDVSVTEGNSGTINANFTVSLSAASAGTVSLQYATANGTATAFAAQQSASNPAAIAIPSTGSGSSPATPYPSTISVSGIGTASKVKVTLNGFSHTFTRDVDILLVGPTGQTVVLMSDAGGSSTSSNLTLTFDDAAATALGTGALATGTYRPTNIADNEGLDSYPGPAPAGPYGSTLAGFAGLNANGVWSLYVVDDFSGDGGSLAGGWSLTFDILAAGADYLPTSGTLTFAPGETSKQISVPVFGDTIAEGNETFFVNLSNPSSLVITDSQGQGTIINDDALVFLSINDVAITEGNAGTTNATFTVTLSPSSPQTVTVQAQTSNLTAVAGSDYTATGPVTLTFTPGQTSQSFSVPILGDTDVEDHETFQVTLSAPVNAQITDGTGIGTILNDDLASRTFVAATGSDAAACAFQTTPCRNIGAAILQTATDGEVIVLTPGEYETATLAITKGIKITSPSGTVAFIRQPIAVNAPGGRVVLRGLTIKGAGAGNGVTLTAADSLSIEDSTIDRWSVGLRLGNAAAARVSILNSVVRNNTSGVLDAGSSGSNLVAVNESRFEGNGKGLEILTGVFQVRESAFVGNTVSGVTVGPGGADVGRSEFSLNGVGVGTLPGGTVRIGRSRVFGNTVGLDASAGGTLASYGSNVVRGNGTNTAGMIATIPEQ